MYVFPEMLEMTKQEWPSDAHRTVAEKVLLCNSRYFTLSGLMEGAEIIAAIPEEMIKLATAADLAALGIVFP